MADAALNHPSYSPAMRPTNDSEFNALVSDEFVVWAAKGTEYRNGGDRLANFNRTAIALGLTPLQVWGVFAQKHWDAVMNYIRTGTQGAEGIESRLVDIANYARLLRLLVRAAEDTK